jgi:hypothetical protein
MLDQIDTYIDLIYIYFKANQKEETARDYLLYTFLLKLDEMMIDQLERPALFAQYEFDVFAYIKEARIPVLKQLKLVDGCMLFEMEDGSCKSIYDLRVILEAQYDSESKLRALTWDYNAFLLSAWGLGSVSKKR